MISLRSLLQKPFYRYLLIGGSVFAFELIIILFAQQLGASPVKAVAIAYILGTIISFFLQKLVAFGDKRMHHRVVGAQMLATALLIAWNFGFSLLVTKVLQDHAPAVVSRTLALGITTIWNFYLYKTHIFKNSTAAVL